ncbi:LysR family transcriptional regulator [Paracoccus sp. Z330]|uniref:LysR family transcriptional regulator n=1 Tax=Paracoccus onchidii TaxID=3017813 RepID=A0ABT4ZB81_9RHOB|nr:LysR family transcriptional regulator [Paracoccus onchidii]MDB6175920.1 LysR family transcriptional regulator [Paracoccus onchidii]
MFESWDDIRVALAVAREGTVSGAALVLGVHHATVIRRIDALETQLGARLFQRHPRGYALTDAGRTMLQTAGEVEEHFGQMASRISGAGDRIEGELVVTSLPELAPVVMPRLLPLLDRHPGLRLRYLTDARLFRLDAGEAQLAIRAGARPTQPDYVARELAVSSQALYAAQSYLDRQGTVEDLARHYFAVPPTDGPLSPVMRWIVAHVPAANFVMVSNDAQARAAVIRAGLAIGSVPRDESDGLVEVMCLPEWESRLWLVTHVDLHRTPKVQAALAALRG